MKIIDCFYIQDELDLLELRLREHNDHVDKFIISESTLSVTGKEKPLYLNEEWDRFAPWHDKIIHVECTSLYPEKKLGHDQGHQPWDNDLHMRESLSQFAKEQDDDALILHSNVGEIYRSGTLAALKAHGLAEYGFLMPQFRYKMNLMQLQPAPTWVSGGCAMPKKHLQGMHSLRMARHLLASGRNSNPVIAHAGWCYVDILHDHELQTKFNINPESLGEPGFKLHDKSDAVFKPVKIDDYFPEILRQSDIWNEYMIPGEFDTRLSDLAKHRDLETA